MPVAELVKSLREIQKSIPRWSRQGPKSCSRAAQGEVMDAMVFEIAERGGIALLAREEVLVDAQHLRANRRVPGLACHLLGITTQAELNRSPFLEGFVDSEILKHQINQGRRKNLYHFRDQQGLEVDFLFPGAKGGLRFSRPWRGRSSPCAALSEIAYRFERLSSVRPLRPRRRPERWRQGLRLAMSGYSSVRCAAKRRRRGRHRRCQLMNEHGSGGRGSIYRASGFFSSRFEERVHNSFGVGPRACARKHVAFQTSR